MTWVLICSLQYSVNTAGIIQVQVSIFAERVLKETIEKCNSYFRGCLKLLKPSIFEHQQYDARLSKRTAEINCVTFWYKYEAYLN